MKIFDPLVANYYKNKYGGGSSGGGGSAVSVTKKDVNFYDYDGTLLHSYTVDEAQRLTELPALPEQKGLICQGWNWSLDSIKAHNRAVDVGAMYITDDGKTRLYIHLEEGRTAPMVGVCPKGTVTVDWGDGTEPDVLTGTSTSTVKWTPNHQYAKAGDYVITLTVDGEMGFYGNQYTNEHSGILRYSSSSKVQNYAYRNSVRRVEIGKGVTSICDSAFYSCYNLASIFIPSDVTSIGVYAFYQCYSLTSVVIPKGVTSIGKSAFYECHSLTSVVIPNSVTSIDDQAFSNCDSLTSVVIPKGVTHLGSSVFYFCKSLESAVIPNGVTSIGVQAFGMCYSLQSIAIQDGVTSLDGRCVYNCYSLTSVVIPKSVTSISGAAFYNCYSVRYYDFTSHTAVPTLSDTSAFSGIPSDCEIRVPAALYDEWKAATNWATYASNIVAV